MESVRYAATLDTGEGFVAFAGGYAILPEPILEVGEVELPADARILPDGYAVWPWQKLRRMVPTDGEYIYLLAADSPYLVDVKMATDLGNGYVLVGTDHGVPALWGGKVTEFVFDRAAYIEVAMA